MEGRLDYVGSHEVTNWLILEKRDFTFIGSELKQEYLKPD